MSIGVVSRTSIVAEWIRKHPETVTREELMELILSERRMTKAEERHWVRKKELKQQLTSDNYAKWLHLSETGWFTTEELEEWLVVHQSHTDNQMEEWIQDIVGRKLQTEEEWEMAEHCITIKQLAEGIERLKVEKKLNKKEFSLWLPYRRQLGVQHLNEWLQLRTKLIDEERTKWTRQRRLNGQFIAVSNWLIVEQRVLAKRFNSWLSKKNEELLKTMNYTNDEWFVNRPG